MEGAKRPFDIKFRDTRKKQFFSIFASFLFLMTNVEDVKKHGLCFGRFIVQALSQNFWP